MSAQPPDQTDTIPVVREDVQMGRESVQRGVVRVRIAEHHEPWELPVEATVEFVTVEHRPVGREVPQRQVPWHDGDTLVIPVYEERLVTKTVTVLVEEVHLRTQRQLRSGVVVLDLRHDVVAIERQDASGAWHVINGGEQAPPPAAATNVTSNRSMSMNQTVVALFDQRADAERARERLVQRGIYASSISVTDAQDEAQQATPGETGVLASVRNFFADLFSGGSDAEMGTYSDAVRRGGAVLKVDVDDEQTLDFVRDELDQAGAANIDERLEQGQQELSAEAVPTSAASPAAGEESLPGATAAPSAGEGEGEGGVIPVVQESVAVGKRSVRAGGVRVFTRVVSEPVRQSVELREERATVTRRAVDRPATADDLGAPEERTIEVTEMVERPVVEKTARVVEEVVVGKEVRQTQATVEDSVRHTEVAVDTLQGSPGTASTTEGDRLDRQDYAEHFAAAGGRYEDYRPAYEFGRSLRAQDRYTGMSWEEVEPHARSDWNARYPESPWERFKDAAKRSWDRLTE